MPRPLTVVVLYLVVRYNVAGGARDTPKLPTPHPPLFRKACFEFCGGKFESDNEPKKRYKKFLKKNNCFEVAFLVINIPPIEVLVKKEYLYDHTRGHGEYEEGIWVTCKSIQGRALYFETFLPETGALYDKLPISAFVWKKTKENLPLEELELWDAFSYHITMVQKRQVFGAHCKYLAPSKKFYEGEYLFTIDSCHPDSNIPNIGYSETPAEHKSFNILKLDNGHFAAQPNNRVIFYDKSRSPSKMKKPDYKVSTIEYGVEDIVKWTAGDTDDYFYE